MFYSSVAFNQLLDRWNLAAATDISYVFHSARAFNQPLVTWDIATIAKKENVVTNVIVYCVLRFGGPQDTATDDVCLRQHARKRRRQFSM